MTNQTQSVIIGCYKNGATLEQIYFEMELDKQNISVVEVKKVIDSITPEKYENERYSILKEFSNNNTLS